MAAKIFALLMILPLSASATCTTNIPHQCSIAPPTPQCLPQLPNVGFEHQIVQYYRLQQAIAASILQQPSTTLLQLLLSINQVSMANPIAYLQQPQLLPLNQLAVANQPAYMRQQLLALIEMAVANPATFWQQQQLPFNSVAMGNAAGFLQQQQLMQLLQLPMTNCPASCQQQPIYGGAVC